MAPNTVRRIVVLLMTVGFFMSGCQSTDEGTTTALVAVTTTESVDAAAGPLMVPSRQAHQYLTTYSSDGSTPICPELPPGVIIDPAPTSVYLESTDAWYEVPLSLVTRAMQDSVPTTGNHGYQPLGSDGDGVMAEVLGEASLLAQRRYRDGPFARWVFDPGFEELLELDTEGQALIGLDGLDPETAVINYVVLAQPDGGFSLSGKCNSVRQLSVISGYRSGETQMSQYEIFRAIVTDDAELEAFAAWIRR